MDYAQKYQNFERSITEANFIIPPQVWPTLANDAFWELYPIPYTTQLTEPKNLF